jgi:hypothetical protein
MIRWFVNDCDCDKLDAEAEVVYFKVNLTFSCRKWRKSRQISLRIADLRTGIQTKDIPSRKQVLTTRLWGSGALLTGRNDNGAPYRIHTLWTPSYFASSDASYIPTPTGKSNSDSCTQSSTHRNNVTPMGGKGGMLIVKDGDKEQRVETFQQRKTSNTKDTI